MKYIWEACTYEILEDDEPKELYSTFFSSKKKAIDLSTPFQKPCEIIAPSKDHLVIRFEGGFVGIWRERLL